MIRARHLSHGAWLLRRVWVLEHGVVKVGVELVLDFPILLQPLAAEHLLELPACRFFFVENGLVGGRRS